MPNQLIHETSPYLLQHAHNPVEWYPWGEAALQKAQAENKPILVSIGYSACHWCHVMERESFENQQIADLMNAHLVCIKVDREERPDVDAIYMEALQAMGLQGGWPLNVFLMPNARPFYGGTYFPPQNWANLVVGIKRAFDENYDKLQESADGFTQNMLFSESEKYGLQADEELSFSEEELVAVFNRMRSNFDYERGGMNRAPKFPMPSIWKFMLRYYQFTKDERALQHLNLTLDRLALGGIYDILGGGWTRYSTDADWKVPHFEKMLYDNGQLVSLYAEAYALTRDHLYKERVTQTINWLQREMTSPEGGFYSALDADSEGEEGKFYIWKKQEIDYLLAEKSAEFNEAFNITEEGNWEHGNNILHLEDRLWGVDNTQWDKMFATLVEERSKRVRPGLDDKILCSWNGLMLKGLVDAYRYINDPAFLTLALANAHFIQTKMSVVVQTEDGHEGRGLWHNYKNGKATIIAYLEDYASVIDAYTALYQVTFDEQWLHEAEMLTDYVIANFYDTEDQFFYFTDSQGEQLIARKKELFDNVIPASNSIMAGNLYNLGIILDRRDFVDIARLMLAKMKKLVLTDTQWLTNWATLATQLVKPTAEVAIVGPDAQGVRAILDQTYGPNKVFAGSAEGSGLPLLQGRTAQDGRTMIYVCFDKTCQLPTDNISKALELMK
ncbi:thioredoxin domain-containing protein [Emticicia sp. 21SJ11W-3]|uniref:thioredoxin domain-containing protein n=1 Tax=Emticicia sp. 21SJ11W-3 TaxID=2916755 RepID=UPI0020A1A2A5|nr:thioredoxin domain-containing protein [Emticicia sp. 21SJ11W-3]UTA66416.1 thioredoxin domain-containing protein [Emticicia sp. 21SJ11W-3]